MSKTRFNNFDTCSTMESCELSVFRDGDVARYDWEQNFHVIEHDSYDKTATYFFTDFGQVEAPSCAQECYDFSKCTYRDFRAAFMAISGESFEDDARTCRDHHGGDWKEMFINWLEDDYGIYQCTKDEFPDVPNAELLVETCSITGYSQGDYANVAYWRSSIWASVDPETGEPLPEDTIKRNMRHHFCNLTYNAPIYCRLVVKDQEGDMVEHYFDSEVADNYEWDTDEIMKIARETFKLSETVLEWLKENLPEYPQYS